MPYLEQTAEQTVANNAGPVDISALTVLAKDYDGLMPQPENPKFKCALIQVGVRSMLNCGTDKATNCIRYDATVLANGVIKAGCSCQVIHYLHEEKEKFKEVCKQFDGLVIRVNPGAIAQDGGVQADFDAMMMELKKEGISCFPPPGDEAELGAKDALVRIRDLEFGALKDSELYTSRAEMETKFRAALTNAFKDPNGGRVLKPSRGSAGEGVWIVQQIPGETPELEEGPVKSGCCGSKTKVSDAGLLPFDTKLKLTDASDGHSEVQTLGDFITFCAEGREAAGGDKWTATAPGKFFETAGGMVDQRFCPRIVEGEIRVNMVGDRIVTVIHKQPAEGSLTTVGGVAGTVYTFFEVDESGSWKTTPTFKDPKAGGKYAEMLTNSETKMLPYLMPSLGLPKGTNLPLWWTSDFINAAPKGQPDEWVVGEFNASCVGISKLLAACAGDLKMVSAEDFAGAEKICDLIGSEVERQLTSKLPA